MSKSVKLPDCLKSWKINACVSEEKGNALYKVSKKEYDGTVIYAKLRYISITKDEYTSENIEFINNEVTFLKSICQSGDYYNYIDIAVNNNPAKERIELFLVTDELPTLAEVISNKTLDEAEIIDFGIQMSEILEKIEANNIFHGNINLENIYVTSNNKYKLGGFSDFESQIEDMSFIAPEIRKNENADFTTDIYSLGLILYYLCNNQKLPFMSDSVSKEDAINARFEGKAVNAPANGNEKLKSVIVIACQPNNENRWKNAGNIKNALTSIKSEMPAKAKADVIVPETTDFSGNVFDEYEYEEFVETSTNEVETPTNETTESTTDPTESTEESQNIEEAIEINTEIDSDEYTDSSDDTDEIDNRVFDDYKVKGKVINFNQNTNDKDYGNFFDDDKVEELTNDNQSINTQKDEDVINYDVDSFEDEFEEESTEENENNKKNKLIIIICILIMLAALGFVGFFIFNNVIANNNTNTTEETTISTTQQIETTTSSTVATTQQSTTEPVTTVPETTVMATTGNTNVIPVVGYGYSYAKKLLEEAGFIVEIGEYEYSEYYEEGYVIAQSPNGDTEAKKGSVITLDISLGLIQEETTQPKTEPVTNNQATDTSYLFSNSDSAYLSQSDVDALDRTNLNLALNEIYARRGRIFKDASLSAYFNSKTWYTPKYTSEEFSANVTFNKYEEANLQLMVNEQKSRGYR